MAICTALKSSNINLPEGRVIWSSAYKMQNKGRNNSSLALKVLTFSKLWLAIFRREIAIQQNETLVRGRSSLVLVIQQQPAFGQQVF